MALAAGAGNTAVDRATLNVTLSQDRLARARAMGDKPALSDIDWQLFDFRMQLLQMRSSMQ